MTRTSRNDPIAKLLLENIQPRSGRGGWHGGPTAVGALRGVSAAQAAWKPAAGRKSIWDLVLHIAYWKYAVRRRLEGGDEARFPRSPANWPLPPDSPDEKAWTADLKLLKDEHARLLETVARIPLESYGEVVPAGKRWTFGEMIVGIAQHDAYHTGQVQLLRRLYSARARGPHRERSGRRRNAT